MKTMKTTNGMIIAVTAGMLLAAGVGAEVSEAVSDETPLDTRSLATTLAAEDQDLETRSYTMDWSEERTLNTKEITGTLILIR